MAQFARLRVNCGNLPTSPYPLLSLPRAIKRCAALALQKFFGGSFKAALIDRLAGSAGIPQLQRPINHSPGLVMLQQQAEECSRGVTIVTYG